jgi:hypothetical protein
MSMMRPTSIRPVFFHARAALPAAAWSPPRRPGSILTERVGAAPLSKRWNAAFLPAEAARQDPISGHAPLRAVALLERGTGVPLRGTPP